MTTYMFDERALRKNYSDRDRIVLIPPTTDSALVFPYDKSNKRFDRNFYSGALTDGRLHSDQLERFFEKIETKVNKKIGKVQKLMKLFGFFAVFSFIILGLYGICLFAETDFADEADWSVYDDIDSFFIAFIGLFFAIIFYSIILSLYSKRSYRKTRKSVERFINKQNPEFAAIGLRWNLPMSFPQWIELWKDYKGQSVYEQPQVPQTQHSYALPIQAGPVNQYPILPALPQQNPSSNQNQQNFKNVMNQPLLSQQGQDTVNYVPPHQLTYNNFQN